MRFKRHPESKWRDGQSVWVKVTDELSRSVVEWANDRAICFLKGVIVDYHNTMEDWHADGAEDCNSEEGIIIRFGDEGLSECSGAGGEGCNFSPSDTVYVPMRGAKGKISFMESNNLGDFPKKKITT